MTQVRILRLLEYTYENQEAADRDKMRWGVPPGGAFEGNVKRYEGHTPTDYSKVIIRSSIIEHPYATSALNEEKVNQIMGSTAILLGEDGAPA